jgi:cytoskeletal protein CcmA (bactofilin family)
MTTYNNLEIAEVSLTFSGELDPSISTRTFDLSTLSFLPNVPLIDQIEVERIFDTGYDTKFGENIFTIADRRQIFILPKAWYSINEQTKILTVVDLSTIPTYTTNGLYYPSSRTFVLETLDSNNAQQTLDIPNFLVNNVGTNVNGVVRQPDTVIIRRKTLSIDSIVTFAPGTRLTTTQLNLQFNQLKYILQELVAKVRNEIILKFDENAVDGPFLGGSDLKMSNNYINDLNSLSIGEVNEEFSTGVGAGIVSGATFATNVGAVYDALTQGTVHRTTMNGGVTVPFSGHFTATPDGGSPLRITNMANAVDDTDAATLGQIRNASNLTQGTLDPARIQTNSLPLTKLSEASGQGYTLPVDALANSGATAGNYGVSTAGNTNNMVYMTVDAKGRATTISSRNMTVDDLPISGVNASTYGNGATPLVELVVDSKGRITGATERAIAAGDLLDISATNIITGTLNADRLATSGVSAGTTTIPNSITVDNKGRVTAIAGGSIPAANVSGFDTQVRTNRLDQMAAPTASVSFGNQKITNLDTPAVSADAATKGYVDGYAAPLSTFNTNVTNLIQTNSVYWDSGNDRYTAQRSAINKKITGVADPSNSNDVVNLNYFNTNALAVSGGVINANSNPIINVTMRSGGSLAANDAVNYGYVQALTLYGQAVTDPQTFTNAWPTAGTIVNGNKPYEFSLATLAATTAEMLIVTDSEGRIYIPSTAVPAAAGRFFRLDTGVSPKKVIVYLDSAITPSGSVFIRNFGTSRSVSASIAGAATLGLVQVPTAGGLLINSGTGDITLNTATAAQIGGIKLGTGLVDIGSSVIKVDLSDSTSLNSSVKAASSKAVKDTYDYAVGVNSTVSSLSSTVSSVSATATAAQNTANAALARSGGTMTGKLITVTPASGAASIVLPSGSAPTTPISGDVWNNAGTLQFYNGSATKSIAFTDSSITGNAATATQWTTGRTIQLTGAVTGTSGSFNGTSNLSFATTLSASAAVISLQGTANQVLVNSTSGTATAGAITLTLPQSIGTSSTPTFAGLTSNNIQVGNTSGTITTTTTNQNLILSANGTGFVNIADNADIDGTLNVDGASTLVGNTTIQGSVSVTAGASKIAMGADASTATTSINRQNTTASPADVGDLILRVPTDRKAFLVANNTIATAAVANDELITRHSLNQALTPYALTSSLSTYMATSGTLVTGATNQVLGTGASATGSFIVKTDNTDRLTINAAGTTSIASGLSVTGNALFSNNLTVSGTTSLNGTVTLNNALKNSDITVYASATIDSYLTKAQHLLRNADRYYEVNIGGIYKDFDTTANFNFPLDGLPVWLHWYVAGSNSGSRIVRLVVPANQVIYIVGYTGVHLQSVITSRGILSPWSSFVVPTQIVSDTTFGLTLRGAIPTPIPVSTTNQTYILMNTTSASGGGHRVGFLRVK